MERRPFLNIWLWRLSSPPCSSLLFFFYSCFSNEACSCSAHPAPGSDYVNRQRSWSHDAHEASSSLLMNNLRIPLKIGTSAPPTPLNLSPCVTPILSRNASKCSSIQGSDHIPEENEDICIVVTEADPILNPWDNSRNVAGGEKWMANFVPVFEQEQKEHNSPKKRSTTPSRYFRRDNHVISGQVTEIHCII